LNGASLPIVFATDFGPGTEWVGVCHAVMVRIAPQARIIDLTHTLPKFDARAAGLILRDVLPYAPRCAAALVVDPGVGTQRRAILVLTERGDLLAGPDNGLLPLAAEAIGGVAAARSIETASTSFTFHARDVFCPAAARLSTGTSFAAIGPDIAVSSLVRAAPLIADVREGPIECEVLDVDVFGNVRLSIRPDALQKAGLDGETLNVETSRGRSTAVRRDTFGALAQGEVGAIVDSFGWMTLCLNRASAADMLGLARGSRITLSRGGAVDL